MQSLRQDLQYALRLLRKSPGFTITAILTLALGIGANTAIFSVAEAYFLRPLPGNNPAQLVTLITRTPQGASEDFSLPEYRDIEEGNDSFAGILAYSGHAGFLDARGDVRLIAVSVVSRNYFEVLGINAIHGRTFSSMSSASVEPSIVLSYAVWQGDFGGDPALVGKSVTLTNKSYTVTGIAPPSFRGLSRFVPADAWVPIDAWYSAEESDARGFRDFQLVGRLKGNTSAAQAGAQLNTIAGRLAQAYPATNAARTFGLVSEGQRLRTALAPTGLLLAVAGMVLLIACANIAGLLVARSEARRREIAIRLALGASRWRLLRQLLAESAILGVASTLAAVLIGWWLTGLQSAFLPPAPIRIGASLQMNGPVAAFTLLMALIAVLMFGLAPAIRASRADVLPALKSEGGSGVRSSGRSRIRNVFAVGEVALAVVLLSGAGLLLRSLLQTLATNLGFDTQKKLLLVDLVPGIAGLNESQTVQYFDRLALEVAALPGVEGVTFALRAPLSGSGGGRATAVSIPGAAFPQGQPTIDIKYNSVAPGYFRTLATTIVRGRAFLASDGPDASKVVIVNETMAQRFWPNGDAIGRTVQVSGTPFQIVGIAENVRINSVHESPEPYMYFPFSQKPGSEGTLIVTTAREPTALSGMVRSEIRSINPHVLLVDIMSMGQVMQEALWNDRMATELVAGLGLLGIFLGAIGLYGVVSYLVNGRMREIGVRMALGAQRGDILRIVVGQGLKLAIVGAAIGLAIALAAGRLMASFLYGVSPRDPAALAAACVVVFAVALAASYVPAKRALKVDPLMALKYE